MARHSQGKTIWQHAPLAPTPTPTPSLTSSYVCASSKLCQVDRPAHNHRPSQYICLGNARFIFTYSLAVGRRQLINSPTMWNFPPLLLTFRLETILCSCHVPHVLVGQ
ncbi:hypothetical protein B0I35DRAFT_423036 [Stachybotrys elegans]|uniref:Uncharacterized protein n=1 Tax=Stachybotrys elegans TaxID=80388 RepID=A0A8K0T166_9HYPO|nr:hypothetical protein B0I35DRAFT_423036 [Stachybotrys elegans]